MFSALISMVSRARLRAVAVLMGLFPLAAFASGGESVQLKFSNNDLVYLYVSLGLSLLAIAVGFIVRSQVLSHSTGSDKMREVGAAIEDGARAYLKRQVTAMLPFVGLLAVGLYFLGVSKFGGVSVVGIPLPIWLAISFILGVLASYVAGYVGMIMAVQANMRVAHAALKSYKGSLEIAFRSGAVAGMITVGMGLLGATLIFLVAKGEAMKLLVGFGFGGSLAALFMRVGGGIYTKAADVGADLVGKVEAGIPEDDPRNAATIADNVGDNVGDCAGMAADVFESYEVTLVAAIVLGAATAPLFPPGDPTWMKLILFALMARGVGIIASIVGIFMVRGNDSEKTDPLAPITQGFWSSAIFAGIATAGLAFMMMKNIDVSNFVNHDGKNVVIREIDKEVGKKLSAIQTAEQELKFKPENASKQDYKPTPKEIVAQIKASPPKDMMTQKPITFDKPIEESEIETLKNDSSANAMIAGRPLSSLANTEFVAARIEQTPPAIPGQTPQKPITMWTITTEDQIKSAGAQVKVLQKHKARFALSDNNEVYLVVSGGTGSTAPKASDLRELRMASSNEKPDPDNAMRNPLQYPSGVAIETISRVAWWRFAIAIFFGIVMAWVIERLTSYFVSFEKKPVKEIAMTSSAGPAPMIIQGIAYGMESSVWSLLAIVVALIAPLFIFPPGEFGGLTMSFYGIALVGLGLLTTTGYILAMDTFGPISDNAQGVYEMSGAKEDEGPAEAGKMGGSRAVQRLDAAGNTTKALTKGFAIATAVVAAVALFHSYIEDAHLVGTGLRIDLPQIFIGLLIGGATPFLFSAFSISAVGRASFELINEVRRQFKADPGIMAGTSKPNYGKCVDIVTAAAQRELLGPAILAIAFPGLVAFGLSIGAPTTIINGQTYQLTGAQALGGFLAGAILSGQLLAVMLANSGGAWDNAKKTIEDGLHGGKGTEAHKAGVVCDTVGDPFKDTAGPALNPLIKVMNLVSLLIAPVVIMPLAPWILYLITGICIVMLTIAVWWSKRGSFGEMLSSASHEGS
ncbi:MAG: sodium/proton-translocating pyrophosphatase [Fimbriimonadales bacterium]